MTITTTISGWGNYPKQEAQILKPASYESLRADIRQDNTFIARGMGRSYGDSSNAPIVLETSFYNHFLEFNSKTGHLIAEAGITLREILKLCTPRGWALPVTPGTGYVTLGGAIASDVHGKNHHISGTFGQHVISFNIMLGTGEIVTASPTNNSDLFHATCGGMGLTGVIIDATIKLIPIHTSIINQKTIKANCIEAACEAFEEYSNYTYSVAWIDCLARGKRLGRSVLKLGEHAQSGGLELAIKDPISVPFYTPSILLNGITMKSFNEAYWLKAKHGQTKRIPLIQYFYPLDNLGFWNKFYGKSGFLQYQCVIPKANGIANMRRLLTEIAESGDVSFLTVLKQFGKENDNLLSFPTEGYTLSLDFKLSVSTIKMFHRLNNLLVDMGGRVYLTKDAVMQEATFKSTYPKWEEFETVRQKYGAIGNFSSSQSKRLGLG